MHWLANGIPNLWCCLALAGQFTKKCGSEMLSSPKSCLITTKEPSPITARRHRLSPTVSRVGSDIGSRTIAVSAECNSAIAVMSCFFSAAEGAPYPEFKLFLDAALGTGSLTLKALENETRTLLRKINRTTAVVETESGGFMHDFWEGQLEREEKARGALWCGVFPIMRTPRNRTSGGKKPAPMRRALSSIFCSIPNHWNG